MTTKTNTSRPAPFPGVTIRPEDEASGTNAVYEVSTAGVTLYRVTQHVTDGVHRIRVRASDVTKRLVAEIITEKGHTLSQDEVIDFARKAAEMDYHA